MDPSCQATWVTLADIQPTPKEADKNSKKIMTTTTKDKRCTKDHNSNGERA